jgi:hypothetical protein
MNLGINVPSQFRRKSLAGCNEKTTTNILRNRNNNQLKFGMCGERYCSFYSYARFIQLFAVELDFKPAWERQRIASTWHRVLTPPSKIPPSSPLRAIYVAKAYQ